MTGKPKLRSRGGSGKRVWVSYWLTDATPAEVEMFIAKRARGRMSGVSAYTASITIVTFHGSPAR